MGCASWMVGLGVKGDDEDACAVNDPWWNAGKGCRYKAGRRCSGNVTCRMMYVV